MSDIQKILKSIADSMDIMTKEQMRVKLYTVVDTLDGISSYYHDDAVKAAFCIKEEEDA